MREPKLVTAIGWFAASMAVAMYLSFIDQIILNLGGHPGSIILPLVTVVNTTAWSLYGALKTPRDWPIILCNIPGIVIGLITAVTAWMARA